MARSGWLSAPPVDPRTLRAAREDMLARGLLAPAGDRPPVRDVIERSWRRCVASAVPTYREELPYRDVGGMTPTLREAATPVLQRMSEHLAEVQVAMFVSNDRGQIVLRHAHEARHRRMLDRACAAEGFDFSETSIGTNGMGTVLAERRPVIVHGAEHYNELLEQFTCAATPIFEPFTQRLLGTFSLACSVTDASPLMYGLTTDVGRQIEANLTSMLGAREQALIRAYLMAESGARDPVIVLTERTVFANTAGVPHLDSESHAVLWDHLSELPSVSGPVPVRVPLSAGWRDAVVESVEGSHGQQAAWSIRLLPEPASPAGVSEAGRTIRGMRKALATSAHRTGSTSAASADDPFVRALDARRTLALAGGPGTGKLHHALALAGAEPGQPSALVLDVSGFRPGRGPQWTGEALDALDGGRPVVLRHLQDLEPVDVNRVRAVAQAAGDGDRQPGLLMTLDESTAPEHVRLLVETLAPVVHLPALAGEPRRIAELVSVLLGDLADEERRPRLSSDALQSLMHWTWPGNIAELRGVLEQLVRTFPGRTVRQADLPVRVHQRAPRRTATLMESAERQAIITALQQCDGNRSRAAEVLGIGRTTLYRKMQQLRIDS